MNHLALAYAIRTALVLVAVTVLIATQLQTPQPDLAATPAGDGTDFVRCRAD